MNSKRVLVPATISLDLKSTTKEALITEMVDLLAAAGKLGDRELALKAILDREHKMSTGMQNGIAIPHGKTNAVETLVAAIGLHKTGVDFGSLDGLPSRIFVMTLSPETRTGPHIQFLAEVSRQLNDAALRERLLQATTPEEVLTLLAI